jgi:16S rRNA (guanine966-N2)-methyltransferase
MYRSRVLRSLKGPALRPTSDRLRETLFNVLGSAVAGSRFLDLFAGTGAVGIEALSRGATEAVFIENHAPAAALIRRNLESLRVSTGAKVLCTDAVRGLEKLAARHRAEDPPFDLVFVDPPYVAEQGYTRVLDFLGETVLLAPGSIVIAEHRRTFLLPERIGNLTRTRVLRQGDAALSLFRR